MARRVLMIAAVTTALVIPAAAPAARKADPSEEMTAEELQTIVEPLPAPTAARPDSAPGSPADSTSRATAGALWRVQVFATQDPGLADRIAREAAQLLAAKAYVAREASQYKVRLGDYGSEGEAADLKVRAVRSGFPGAFRIRCAPNPTINKP
jgi:hypothetical protein